MRSSFSDCPDCHVEPVVVRYLAGAIVECSKCGRCTDDSDEEIAIESWNAMLEEILSDRGVA
jgi:ribosomal protein L37AE/L43A